MKTYSNWYFFVSSLTVIVVVISITFVTNVAKFPLVTFYHSCHG